MKKIKLVYDYLRSQWSDGHMYLLWICLLAVAGLMSALVIWLVSTIPLFFYLMMGAIIIWCIGEIVMEMVEDFKQWEKIKKLPENGET